MTLHMPDDGHLVDVIPRIATDEAKRTALLVDNPMRLYWREWLAEVKPDVVIVVYNDHGLNLFLDKMPTFSIGAAPEYQNKDEGWGLKPLPPYPGDPELSWHIIESLVNDEFDILLHSTAAGAAIAKLNGSTLPAGRRSLKSRTATKRGGPYTAAARLTASIIP